MSENPRNLRDKLLEFERMNSEIQHEYEREINKMFNEEIKGAKKIGLWAGNLLRIAFGLGFMLNAFFNQPFVLPAAGRLLWAIAGLALLAMAIVGIRIALQNKMDLRKDSRIYALTKSSGLYVVGFAVLIMALGLRDIQTLTLLTPIALLTIAMGILISIHDRVNQSELNIREKLLEIEYRLAALDERLKGGGGKA